MHRSLLLGRIGRAGLSFLALGVATSALPCAAAAAPAKEAAPLQLFEWERGFGLRAPGRPEADMFLWFYEWNMFEAMAPGQHTHGTYQLPRHLDAEHGQASVEAPAIQFAMRAVPDGAELALRITNRTAYAWPEIAGIIPCWNPGQVPGTNPSMPEPLNRNFADTRRMRSYFLSARGLEPFGNREIHFNTRYRPAVDRAAGPQGFVFSSKWPTSAVDAVAGLLVRESDDGQWVTGIGWEDFLSVQGHNPWSCLHVCIRIGALAPGESRTVRGRLYLFRGTKEDCVARFRRDFRPPGI